MMHTPLFIDEAAVRGKLQWGDVVEALRQGHKLGRAETKDIVIGEAERSFVNRALWVNGLGGGAHLDLMTAAVIFDAAQR